MLEGLKRIDWGAMVATPWVASALRIGLVLILGALLIWLLNRAANRLERLMRERSDLLPSDGQKRLETLQNVVRYIVFMLIAMIILTIVLHELGIDLAPLFAGAGIAGIVIGFGSQSLVKDFLTGIFVMLENQYRVGDWVKVGEASGSVQKVTLRITRLRDGDGNLHVIPNGQVTHVINYTKDWARAVLDVGVAYGEDVDRVMEVLEDIGREMAADEKLAPSITEPLEVMGVQALADSAVLIRIRFKTDPDARWRIQREMRRRVKNRFDAEGIEIPFPHVTIYMGNTSDQPPEPAQKKEED
jgi:small conductance mechanosensitive channel